MKQTIKSAAALTLGCSKNLVDSEDFLSQLLANNINFTTNIEKADALIINTCGFIEPAKEESINAILEACEMKRKGIIKKLIVTGCLSQRYKDELKKQIKEVDHFFGINSSKQIIGALSGNYKHKLVGGRRLLTPSHYAYIKIADGCSQPCSFCAIPSIRGKYISLEKEIIIEEVANLAKGGTKEFILIAQDTTYYGADIYGRRALAELMRDISDIQGVLWLRLMYTYPANFPQDVLELIAERKNICNYIDLPIQHISDKILKSMLRGINRRQTEELIQKIRETLPGAAIRSAFIVGYPNESEQDFLELLDFIDTAELDRVGVFAYSREEGTPAYKLGDPVPYELKQERMDEIMQTQLLISLKKNKAKIGKEIDVLIDEENNGVFIGRTEHDAPEVDNGVFVKSDFELKPGDLVLTKIVDAQEYDLHAEAIKLI